MVFFIVIEVAECSEFPIQAVDCLAEVLDEWKPVIIQLDLIHSAEYLVFKKKQVKVLSSHYRLIQPVCSALKMGSLWSSL